jgi:DNA-binding GntR family transcriptional regulator
VSSEIVTGRTRGPARPSRAHGRPRKARCETAISLTDYIRNDLRRRILSGDDVSPRLSLAALAGEYGVSITPLRNAVNALVAEGFLTRLSNRRLRLVRRRVRTGAPPRPLPVPPTPRDWDTALLKEVMLSSLRPRATYMREESLARKLGVGRSIIRQTFSRFAGVGIIEHVPRRGWLVPPLSPEDMNAYLVVREVLELKALALASGRLETAELRALIASNGRPGVRAAHQLDNRLHDYIIEKSGNRYLRLFFQQYNARYYTELFYHAAPETAVVGQMVEQHRGILEALVAGSLARARTLLSEHIRAQGPILITLLARERATGGGEAAPRARKR